jgi:3-hydroxymyristoyl/3-hydroxydecanoyl-(acyl carrier protein) dehydratase
MPEMSHTYAVPATHPCFAGHFPGNPIVPGVVILDYARALLQQWRPDCRIKTITQAKFLHPLRPGQLFTLTLMHSAPSRIKFECICAGQRFVTGTFLIEDKA